MEPTMLPSYIFVTDEMLADADSLGAAIEAAINSQTEPTPEQIAQREAAWAARNALYSDDLSDFSPDEVAAVNALYNDPDIEVGSEGIGGFYAGQAEATIRTLHKAGFTVQRIDDGATDPTGHTDGCSPGVVHRAADGSGNCPCFCHRWNGPDA